MNIERLFQVLVVTGASSAGVIACGGDSGTGTPSGTGGHASGGASHGDGGGSNGGSGATGTGGAAGSGAMCDCKPSTAVPSWTDCNGCCCWLPVGSTTMIGSQICGEEPCCVGKGR